MTIAGGVSWIDRHSSIIFVFSLLLALLFPVQASILDPFALLFLGIALFFIFLKVNFSEITSYFRRPIFLLAVVSIFLVVIPALVFLVAHAIVPPYAIGFLLLFGVPTAATSAVLVGLFKGNVSLALVLEFLLYLVAPFSLPVLVYFLGDSVVQIDLVGLFLSLLQLLVLPFLAAQLVRRKLKTDSVARFISPVSILMLALAALGSVGKHSGFILDHWANILFLGVLGAISYFVIGRGLFFFTRSLPFSERVTVTISKVFMNGTLALVLAGQFFDSATVMAVVSNILVWYGFLALAIRYPVVLFKE